MKYSLYSECYKPTEIKVLLIGEAPPPNGKSYFYAVPEKYPTRITSIENDTSLPATIFNHYFGRRPNDTNEYKQFLKCLQERGIFLIDIINENLVIKKRGLPFNQVNINKLVSTKNLNELKFRITKLITSDTKIIFLLPTGRPYIKRLREEFPNVSFVNWKCFRLDIHEAQDCKEKTSP